MKITEKRNDRAKALHDARSIVDRADAEKRDMSAEEKENFDKLMQVVDDLAKEIESLKGEARDEGDDEKKDDDKEKLEAAEREADEDKKEASRRAPRMNPESRSFGNSNEARYEKSYRHWLRTGVETRDLSLGTSGEGGEMVAPYKMSEQLVVALNNLCFVRALADVETVNDAKALRIPKITADVSDADWTAEVPSSFTADSALTFADVDLTPQFLNKLVLVSHRMLQVSNKAEDVVMQRLAYKFAVTEENNFLNGNGSNKPLGMYYASSSGISTGRDVTTSSTTVFTADELIQTLYKIPAQYQQSPSFGWILHRDTVARCRQLKDGNGSYIWQMGISADRPDTLLGKPCYQSEYAPNTFTAGLYVALVGDLKFFKIVDVAQMEIQRLVERYADTNQIGFLARRYLNAAPILENAFARLKLHA